VKERDEECERSGRASSEIEISVYGTPHQQSSVAEFAESGVDRVIFGLPPESSETVLPLLDRLASLTEPLSAD